MFTLSVCASSKTRKTFPKNTTSNILNVNTCGRHARDGAGRSEEVINGIYQVLDVYHPHVVVVPVGRPATALYRHQVVIPKKCVHTCGSLAVFPYFLYWSTFSL